MGNSNIPEAISSVVKQGLEPGATGASEKLKLRDVQLLYVILVNFLIVLMSETLGKVFTIF